MNPNLRMTLVHLDPTAASPSRLAAARQIAHRHESEFAVLYATLPTYVAMAYAAEAGAAMLGQLAELDNDRRRKALQSFDAEMAKPGPTADWAQVDDLPVSEIFAQQARYADLLVLGQYNPADPAAQAVPMDFVESVLTASGRPAIVVPHIGWSGPIGDSIAIAWKETPEAARAVQAAMPLLRKARKVDVFTWGDAGTPRIGGRVLDLQGYLRMHGVNAAWHRESHEPTGVAELLLSRSFEVGADLLVMGCYGHSRTREWILGGVSRTILKSMTLPVLMSH